MKAIFIRNKLGCSDTMLNHLWEKRLIAIHFEDIFSTDPKDYHKSSAIKAIKKLNNYCKDGVIVGSTYPKIHPDTILVGEIPAGSQIEKLEEYGNRIYKVVQMEKVREVFYKDYPLLLAVQPRQMTLNGWPSAKNTLESILGMKELEIGVRSLAPQQIEVICYEYMRYKGIIQVLRMPIGRALKDIDIWGLDGQCNDVIAQVTLADNPKVISEKVERLKSYKGMAHIFFGPSSCENAVEHGSMKYIPIELAFQTLLATGKDSIYHRLIIKMLGHNTGVDVFTRMPKCNISLSREELEKCKLKLARSKYETKKENLE